MLGKKTRANDDTSGLAAQATVQRAPAPHRGRLWGAISVVLATVGCAPAGPQAADSQIEKMRHRIAVGPPLNTDISYFQAGNPADPRLILVHGTPGSASGWADYLVQPPPGVEVVALDRPGFGQSGPAGAVTGLEAQAAAVFALFPADGRRVLLLGHSLGGPIVARVAADHPERIAAVLLLAASLDPGLEAIHPMQWVGALAPVHLLLPRSIGNANAELIALKPELETLATLLHKVTAPVFIVHGTKDTLVPVANVPFMQGRFSGARCINTELLEGRNHFLPWNSAEVVRRAIQKALEAAC